MKEIRINLKITTSDPDWTRVVARVERLLELNFLPDQFEIAQAHAQSVPQ